MNDAMKALVAVAVFFAAIFFVTALIFACGPLLIPGFACAIIALAFAFPPTGVVYYHHRLPPPVYYRPYNPPTVVRLPHPSSSYTYPTRVVGL